MIAAELALTGSSISAARAYDLGLVNAVTPQGEALAHALRLAAKIASNGRLAVTESKRMMHETSKSQRGWDDAAWRINNDAIRTVFTSEDA